MFFITYIRRELHRRLRQAIFIALGLALGIGLVITVTAASAGYGNAQSDVLSGLYGVGTDVTVTGAAPPHDNAGRTSPQSPGLIQQGPHGPEICASGGKCTYVAGTAQDNANSPYLGINASEVARAAKLRDVAATGGGLWLLDQSVTFSKSGQPQSSSSYTLEGVDVRRLSVGPLNGGVITSGRLFTGSDSDSDVALADSGYARSHNLKVASILTIHQVKYTVIGIVSQPQEGGNPTDIYIPLARAQSISLQSGRSMKNDVNTIYLTAASAADIPAVSKEVSGLLPDTTVTTASGLASDVTAASASAEKLVNDLGRWLSVLVLIAAFAVASLLTTAGVARRVREFGTLKALGWRSRRIVAQVLGESAAMGVVGAVAGVGLGFAGAAAIAATAPRVSATVGGNDGPQAFAPPGARVQMIGGASLSHPVTVLVHPSISAGLIVLAVILAVAGGLLAGAFGSWRIARLRPADALVRVA